MKVSKNLKELIQLMRKDEKLKRAVDQVLKGSTTQDTIQKARSATDFLVTLVKMSSKFLGKRLANRWIELLEILSFIVQVSLLLKTNVIDRPEVRDFLAKKYGEALEIIEKVACAVRELLKKRKARSDSD